MRLFFGRRTRKLTQWVIEPAISICLVWILFQALFNVSTRKYDVNLDLDLDIDGLVRDDQINPMKNSEDLLFIERHPEGQIKIKVKERSNGDGDRDAKDRELEGNEETEARRFLLGNMEENHSSEKKEQQRESTESLEEDNIVIPNYGNQKQCHGRRWSLTDKSKKQYLVVGYEPKNLAPKGCRSKVCELNRGRSPLQMNLSATTCKVEDCLTVTIKTRFRYENCIQFIRSIHEFYPALKVIVIDDDDRKGKVNQSSINEWDEFLKKTQQLLSYVQAPPGVGAGRKLAAQVAQTKYILVVDDDYLFTNLSNVTRLVDLLERSDASIVGGDTSDWFPYAGAFRIARNHTGPADKLHLAIYPNVFYELVQCFRNCFVADIVKTFFVADRKKILEFGAWDAERKFYEHEDFFINLRKAGLKVVNCKDIKARHAPKDQDLAVFRRESHDVWHKHLINKWGFKDMYICHRNSYNDAATTCSKQRHFY